MKKITSIIIIATFLLNTVLADLGWAVEGAGLAAVRSAENARASAAIEDALGTPKKRQAAEDLYSRAIVGADNHSPFVGAAFMAAQNTGYTGRTSATQEIDEKITSQWYEWAEGGRDQLKQPSPPQPLLSLRGHLSFENGKFNINDNAVEWSEHREYSNLLHILRQVAKRDIEGLELIDTINSNSELYSLLLPQIGAPAAVIDEIFVNTLLSYLTPEQIAEWRENAENPRELCVNLFKIMAEHEIDIDIIFEYYSETEEYSNAIQIKIINNRPLSTEDRERIRKCFDIFSQVQEEVQRTELLISEGLWTEHSGRGLLGFVMYLARGSSLYKFREYSNRTEQTVRLISGCPFFKKDFIDQLRRSQESSTSPSESAAMQPEGQLPTPDKPAGRTSAVEMTLEQIIKHIAYPVIIALARNETLFVTGIPEKYQKEILGRLIRTRQEVVVIDLKKWIKEWDTLDDRKRGDRLREIFQYLKDEKALAIYGYENNPHLLRFMEILQAGRTLKSDDQKYQVIIFGEEIVDERAYGLNFNLDNPAFFRFHYIHLTPEGAVKYSPWVSRAVDELRRASGARMSAVELDGHISVPPISDATRTVERQIRRTRDRLDDV